MPLSFEQFRQKEVLTEADSSVPSVIMPPFMHTQDPPAVLMMRRTAIRQYPNGQRVALYHVDKLNTYVSIPYNIAPFKDQPQSVPSVNEEEVLEEGASKKKKLVKKPKKRKPAEPRPPHVFAHLQKIVKEKKAQTVQFEDGKTMKVDPIAAGTIVDVHGKINKDNQEKLKAMINTNRSKFMNASAFAHGVHSR